MKILILSNLYPPYHIGGYEIGCKDVTDALVSRGHEIRILTSRYKCSGSSNSNNLYRELFHSFPNTNFTSSSKFCQKLIVPFHQFWNQSKFKKHVGEFQPDVVFFWNLSHIGPWLFDYASQLGVPSACYVSDQWLVAGYHDSSYPIRLSEIRSLKNGIYSICLFLCSRILRLRAKSSPPHVPRMFFTSRFIEKMIRSRLSPPDSSEVIHWAVHPSYINQDLKKLRVSKQCIHILCSGRIVEEKGIRTAILGVASLINRFPNHAIKFKLAGGGDNFFIESMKKLILDLGLTNQISFVGKLSREDLMALYIDSEIYIFPSEWDEPFAISPLEAMALGSAVVGTTTGGSAELLKNEENSLTYPPGDHKQLANCLERLLIDTVLREKLVESGYNQIIESHQMHQMVDRIEENLKSLVSSIA